MLRSDDIGKAGILDPFQPTLNPCLWQGESLKPEVRDEIVQVANELAQLTGVEIQALLMFGGSAGYQYSSDSDIDVSVYPKNDTIDNYEKTLDVFRNRIEHICGLELHFFLKDDSETEIREASEAVYDILNNQWITKPVKHDFNPFVEWSDKIVHAEEVSDILREELSKLKAFIYDIKGTTQSLEPVLPVLTKFAKIITKLREKRKQEHKELRKKALKEDISVHDRATQNEILWKYLDRLGILSKLDFMKDAVKQHMGESEYQSIVLEDETIDPIYKGLP